MAKLSSTDRALIHAVRLQPGDDLRLELERLAKETPIRAGFLLSGVGSLTKVALRLANQKAPTQRTGHFEIVSITGTLGPDGLHVHLAVSDETGRTLGGHLLEGCVIYTTAEIVIGEALGLIFHREIDPKTTFQELSIQKSGEK